LGPPDQLTKFTSGQIFGFNWTADEKQLLLSRGEVTSDVVLLGNLHCVDEVHMTKHRHL